VQRVVVSILLLVLSTGVAPIVAPQSGPYKPVSDRERESYRRASRTIYPTDILEQPDKYHDSLIVWAALVDSAQDVQAPSGVAVFLFAGHRYFDWIEDRGPRGERFFLSPRGEGTFLLALPVANMLEASKARQYYRAKTMIVAYGYARVVERSGTRLVQLLVTYVQPYPQTVYRQDVLDYGRRGEPIKVLRPP
jgi:hypothetical protein